MCPTKQPLLWRKCLSRLVKVKKMPHGCCVQDPSSPYLLSAWKISFFSQRNQYSGTERKPLGRFALHSSACGLGAGEEGRARTDAGEQCAASHEFPYDSLGAPCLTRITQYKVKAAARIKVAERNSFPFPCHFAVMYHYGLSLFRRTVVPFGPIYPAPETDDAIRVGAWNIEDLARSL